MLRTGGSVRTYLGLLEEAGRTLKAQGQLEKSHYLYLKRHVETCVRLGFKNRAAKSISVAHEVLKSAAAGPKISKAQWHSRIGGVVASSRVLSSELRANRGEACFHAPYSGYWHPSAVSRYNEIDIGSPPHDELRRFEAKYELTQHQK